MENRKKRFFTLVLTTGIIGIGYCQIKVPEASPAATISQAIGFANVSIEYNRQQLKGRDMFADLTREGEVWRTGANMSTRLTTTGETLIEGNKIPAGNYSIYSIPGKKVWPVIINKKIQWGTGYSQEDDFLRVTVPTLNSPNKVESFNFYFSAVTEESANLGFSWGNSKVEVKIEAPVHANLLAQIDGVMGDESKATDGDFNVGASSTSDMVRLIEEKRKSNIYLTITGLMGNYKDGRMEQISNAGNGNYFYIDNIKEARKVFVTEMRSNLFTIAKDVKIQVEFHPTKVQAYRLIGYENRMLNAEDFNDDKKDAGELGAGHTVTALYEIIPAGVKSSFLKDIDVLKYQQNDITQVSDTNELLTVKFRYKKPKEENSRLITHVLNDVATDINETSNDFRWAAAVAEYGQLLRGS